MSDGTSNPVAAECRQRKEGCIADHHPFTAQAWERAADEIDRLGRELRLAISARDYANAMLDASRNPQEATGALVGMVAVPDHPQTVLNPNGRNGFVIVESKVEGGRLLVRGADTMWFGESAILQIKRPDEPLADPIVPIEIGAGKIRVAICYDIGDPDKVLRELVIYDDGEGFKPVGTDLPEHRGNKVPDVGRVLARLRISNAVGAAVFVRDLQTVVEHARVADGGAALTKGETP